MRKTIHLKINKLIIEDSDSPFLQKSMFSHALNEAMNASLARNAQLKNRLTQAQADVTLSDIPALELDQTRLDNHYRLAQSIAEYISKNLCRAKISY